jgi:hypothetical protein
MYTLKATRAAWLAYFYANAAKTPMAIDLANDASAKGRTFKLRREAQSMADSVAMAHYYQCGLLGKDLTSPQCVIRKGGGK